MEPSLIAEFITAFNAEWRRSAGEVKAQATSRERERVGIDRKIANLIETISDGRSSSAILSKLAEPEKQKARFETNRRVRRRWHPPSIPGSGALIPATLSPNPTRCLRCSSKDDLGAKPSPSLTLQQPS